MHAPHSTTIPEIHRIVLTYAVFAGLWILLSDQALQWLISDASILQVVQTLKGWFFVGVTSLLLYFLLKRSRVSNYKNLEPIGYAGLFNWKPWQQYLFAAAVTVITLPIRESITISFGERPLLILFMLPVILSAAIGGLGPGLLSTSIAASFAAYFIPPVGSLMIENSFDLLQLGFLIADGLLVSYLSMMWHEARYWSNRERQMAATSQSERSTALQLLDVISEGSTDAIFVKDIQGQYLLVNESAARFVGKSAQEILGKDDTSIFPTDQAALIQHNDRQVMQDDQVITFQENLDTHDGKSIFLATKGPIHDTAGNVIGVFGISRDITGIKMAEVAIRRERDRNQRYLDTVQSIMIALDDEGRITMITRYGCELLGYRESELLGQNWFTTCLPKPDGLEIVLPIFRQIMAGDLTHTHHYENAVLRRDGSRRMISWNNTCIRNEAGNIVGTLSSGEDVTERKKAEESLRESETTYRSLFNHMLNGFAYCHMLFTNGRPSDFIYLSVNEAFTSHTGLKDVVGRKVSELIPGIREKDPELFEIYGRVALGGPPEHFETYVKALHMWFAISVYSPKPEHFVAVFDVITDRKKRELELRDSEARFRSLVEQSMAGIYIIQDGQLRYVNPGFATIFGYDSPEQLIDLVPVNELVCSRDREKVLENIRRREGGKTDSVHYTFCGVRRDGRRIELEVYGRPYEFEERPAIIGILLDITARKAAEEQLLKLSLAVEQSPESITITDLESNIEYVNEAFVRNTGYSREEIIGQNMRVLHSGKTPKNTYEDLWKHLTEGKIWQGEFYNKRKDGSEFIEHAILSPIRQADGLITHYVAIKENLTEKKRSEAELNRLAFYDTLTGLPNRSLLLERMEQTLALTRRGKHKSALILFNIDRFNTINDAGGQALGDLLLKAMGERISLLLREADVLSRVTGDEFAILLPDFSAQQSSAVHQSMHVAEKILANLHEPFCIGDNRLTISVCLGIALFPESEEDTPLDILRRSNTSLHFAKSKGTGQTAFFEGELDKIAMQRFNIERELREGIPSGELRLYLQQQVNAAGKTVGAEALVRWQHPERGLLPPVTFIPFAEESDLIIEVGEWVFVEVCRLLVANEVQHPMRFAVNISPRHFRRANFVTWIKNVLAESNTDPTLLTLEITEGMVIHNINDVISKMKELSSIGIHFSMDDFGTGYSSLSHLKRLPIDELKIDKSFIQDITTDPEDAALVETILTVARLMHLKVVAEGVETIEQAEFLNERATVIHQGYLYGKPEQAEKLFERLNA